MSIGSVNVPGSIGAGRVINTNILDNSHFQINQRDGKIVKPNVQYFTDIGLTQQAGITSSYMKVIPAGNVWAISVDGSIYYVSGAHVLNGYVGHGYTVDRWFLWESDTVAVLTDGGIEVFRNVGSSSTPWLTQKFEDNTLQPGIYTFSVLSTNGVAQLNAHIAGIGDILNYSTDEQFATATFIVPNTVIDKSAWVSILGKSDSAVIAAELELGPVQTLVHKDASGNWVLNDPLPNKALELLKCQRYFEKGVVTSAILPWPGITFLGGKSFLVEKRAIPVVKIYCHDSSGIYYENRVVSLNGDPMDPNVIQTYSVKDGLTAIKLDGELPSIYSYSYLFEASSDL